MKRTLVGMGVGFGVGWLSAGCTAEGPTDGVRYTERWEVLGITGEGAVIDARVTVGNTGLLRGQGRVEVDQWPRAGEPIRYARWSAPSATVRAANGRTIMLDTDLLRGAGDRVEQWHLRARSDEANVVLQVQGRGQAVPPVTEAVGGGEWSVGAPVGAGTVRGWTEAGERGGKIAGWGIVLHRGGDGRPGSTRRGLYVMSEDLNLGLDEQGPVRLVWGTLSGRALDMSDATITYDAGVVGLDLRPAEDIAVAFELSAAGGTTDRTAHWSPPERWAMSALGGRTLRQVYGGQVEVVAGGLDLKSRRGLVVWTDERPLSTPARVAEAPRRRGRKR